LSIIPACRNEIYSFKVLYAGIQAGIIPACRNEIYSFKVLYAGIQAGIIHCPLTFILQPCLPE
jgi:hypothetical protein